MSTQRETDALLKDLELEYLKGPKATQKADVLFAVYVAALFFGVVVTICGIFGTLGMFPNFDASRWSWLEPTVERHWTPSPKFTFEANDDIGLAWETSIDTADIMMTVREADIMFVGPSGKTFEINLETGETSGTLPVDEAAKIFAKLVSEEFKK